MAESTVGWFVVREKYCLLAEKVWLISQANRPNTINQSKQHPSEIYGPFSWTLNRYSHCLSSYSDDWTAKNIWKFESFVKLCQNPSTSAINRVVGFINPVPTLGGALYAFVLPSLMKSWISPCTLATITGQALCQPNQIKVVNQKV